MLTAQDKTDPPFIQTQIQPEYPAALTSFLIDPVRIELVIDEDGVPYSIKSVTSLPDNVMDALMKWRYKPARRNGKTVGYGLSVVIPIHRSLDDMDGRMSRSRTISTQWRVASTAAKLEADGAKKLETRIAAHPDDLITRFTLLEYARSHTDREARQIQMRQIAWLVANQPQGEDLSAPFASLTGYTAAELGAYEQIRRAWLKYLEQFSPDPAILRNATNFLRFSDPEVVEHALQGVLEQTDNAAVFLGDLYALSALGATILDPKTGRVSTVSEDVARTPFAIKARTTLGTIDDPRVLASALSTVLDTGASLSEAGPLPEGFAALCGSLLNRVKEKYAGTTRDCTIRQPPAIKPVMQSAHLTKSVTPTYPREAKARRIEGTVTLEATIGKDGRLHGLEFKSGPLALYEAARDAILHWEYKPLLLDGTPQDVLTTIDVNFSLNQADGATLRPVWGDSRPASSLHVQPSDFPKHRLQSGNRRYLPKSGMREYPSDS